MQTASSQPQDARFDLPARTVGGCLLAWARRKPDAPAIISRSGRVSYSELAEGAAQAAGWLRGQGVQPGDLVACWFETVDSQTKAQIELAFGLALLGATLLPLYPDTTRAHHVAHMRHFEARFCLAGSDQAALLPAETTWLNTTAFAGARTASVPKAGPEPKTGIFPADVGDPSLGFLVEFSSGSTGKPKAVQHDHRSYLATLAASAEHQGWRNDDVFQPPGPWPVKVGLRGVFRTICAGGAYLHAPFANSLGELASLIVDLGLTSASAAPAELRQLLATAWPQPGPRPALRLLNVTGAPLAPGDLAAARELLCANLHVVLGGTEAGIIGSCGPNDPPDGLFSAAHGVQMQIVDASGQELTVGQSGRLRIRSPWMCQSYLRNPEASAQSFGGGWYLTGDEGRLDAHGRLQLLGRWDHVINFGGAKIQPQLVEAALLDHPAVADAVLLAYPDPVDGDLPVAFVVFRQRPDMQAFRSFLEARLDTWQVPRGLVGVKAIPRTSEGKLNKQPLLDLYASYLSPAR